ncbi:hypothetical protein D3C85_1808840 [compost metagenome]
MYFRLTPVFEVGTPHVAFTLLKFSETVATFVGSDTLATEESKVVEASVVEAVAVLVRTVVVAVTFTV